MNDNGYQVHPIPETQSDVGNVDDVAVANDEDSEAAGWKDWGMKMQFISDTLNQSIVGDITSADDDSLKLAPLYMLDDGTATVDPNQNEQHGLIFVSPTIPKEDSLDDTLTEYTETEGEIAPNSDEDTCSPGPEPDDEGGVESFANEDDWKDHFSDMDDKEAKKIMQRNLLAVYAPTRMAASALRQDPFYHRVEFNTLSCEEVDRRFFDRFKYDSFALKGGHVIPTEQVRPIKELMDEEIEQVKAYLDDCRGRRRGAMDLGTELVKMRCAKTEIETAEDAIFKASNKWRNKGHDLGPVNGEFRRADLKRLCVVLSRLFPETIKDLTFVDLGSNTNLVPLVVANRLGCKAWGIECVELRQVFASLVYCEVIGRNFLRNTCVGFVSGNILHHVRYKHMDIAYAFDQAFGDELFHHYVGACTLSEDCKCIISTRAYRRSIRFVEKLGWKKAETRTVYKAISGEGNTLVVYVRDGELRPSLEEVNEIMKEYPPAVDLTESEEQEQAGRQLDSDLEICLGDDQRKREKYYKAIGQDSTKSLGTQKSLRVIMNNGSSKYTCVAVDKMIKCRVGACMTCERIFNHRDDLVEKRNSIIHGDGLFAKDHIETNQFLIPIPGSSIDEPRQGYGLALRVKDGVDPHVATEGLHNHVNHSCNANAELRYWFDGTQPIKWSIVSTSMISKGEEITVNYGDHVCHGNFDIKKRCNCGHMEKCLRGVRVLLLGMHPCSDKTWIKNIEDAYPTYVFTCTNQATTNDHKLHIHCNPEDEYPKRVTEFLSDEFCLPSASHFFDAIYLGFQPETRINTGERFFQEDLVQFPRILKAGGFLDIPSNIFMIRRLVESESYWCSAYKVRLVLTDAHESNVLLGAIHYLKKVQHCTQELHELEEYANGSLRNFEFIIPRNGESTVLTLLQDNAQLIDKVRFIRLVVKAETHPGLKRKRS